MTDTITKIKDWQDSKIFPFIFLSSLQNRKGPGFDWNRLTIVKLHIYYLFNQIFNQVFLPNSFRTFLPNDDHDDDDDIDHDDGDDDENDDNDDDDNDHDDEHGDNDDDLTNIYTKNFQNMF